MRTLMIPMALVAGLTLGSTAFAATAPTVHLAPKPAATSGAAKTKAVAPVGKTQTVGAAKRGSCAKTWVSQKTHVGSREAFMGACVSKG